jgi:hypothetical protein
MTSSAGNSGKELVALQFSKAAPQADLTGAMKADRLLVPEGGAQWLLG